MCQGAARARCSPEKGSWEPSVVARLAEAVASAAKSQGAEWDTRVWIRPVDSDQGQMQPNNNPAQQPGWSEGKPGS